MNLFLPIRTLYFKEKLNIQHTEVIILSEKMDVVVIGAGINGSWTALHLAKQGYKVILLEQVKLQKSE